jgi:hypothetical protein
LADDERYRLSPAARQSDRPLWRIHFTATQFPQAWNGMRAWGPLDSARWDAHPLPAGEHPETGVAYLAFDVTTCLAEVFQATRFVDVHEGAPYITLFRLTRPLRVLDVSGDWLMKAGARASVAMGKKSRTRAWARAVREAWPDLDGVVSNSAVAGHTSASRSGVRPAMPFRQCRSHRIRLHRRRFRRASRSRPS